MQTFLPYPDFAQSAKCLDDKRLGKQRVEVLQILNTLAKGPHICKLCRNSVSYREPFKNHDPKGKCVGGMAWFTKTPWYNHPAVQMWKGYEYRLTCYGVCICKEWKERGFNDTCEVKILDHQWRLYYELKAQYGVNRIGVVDESHKPYPTWLGNPKFHASHRSNLLRKSPEHYSQFGWTEPHNLPYIWPTKQNNT